MRDHPLERLRPLNFRLLSAGALLATIAISIYFLTIGSVLEHAEAPFGILSFELIWNQAGWERVVGPWSELALTRAMAITWYDYFFLICYGTAAAALSLTLGKMVACRFPACGTLGRMSAWLAWIAAACDALENTLSLKLLYDRPTQPWIFLMSLFATIKFGLLVVVLLFFLACGLLLLFLRPNRVVA